jgi:hypothetical protein
MVLPPRPASAGLTDADLAAIEARAAAMLAGADKTERGEPDLAAVAGEIRAHGRELAALAAEVRRLRGLLLAAEAEHQRERVAWADRKVELLERVVALEALEAQARGLT